MDIALKTRVHGSTVLYIEKFGARGDGVTDDTAAFARAMAAFPADGGVLKVRKGRYLIDPNKSIKVRNRVFVDCPYATFVSKTTDTPRNAIFDLTGAQDVHFHGGVAAGDRATHIFAPQKIASQNTHEWCHAFRIGGGATRISIHSMTLQDFCGDGISMGLCNDVEIADVIATNNRRQGISVVGGSNILIYRTKCLNTNGTSPECGIDIEPEKALGAIGNIRIIDSVLENNNKYGLNSLRRSDGNDIKGVQVIGTKIINNKSNGCALIGGSDYLIQQCLIQGNKNLGIIFKGTANASMNGCTLGQNAGHAARKTPFDFTGISTSRATSTSGDVSVQKTSTGAVNANLNIGSNHYV